MKRTRIELTVERRRRLTIHRTQTVIEGWCMTCGKQVIMLSREEAAMLLDLDPETVHCQAEEGKLHQNSQSDGTILICVESLFASFNVS